MAAAEKAEAGEIEVLHSSFSEIPDEKGKPQPLTHIVYRDDAGRIGTVTLHRKDPTDGQIADAVKKQREAAAAREPKRIRL